MMNSLETFKNAAVLTYGENTDFIYTASELTAISKAHSIVVPASVWSTSHGIIDRILPAAGKRTKKYYNVSAAVSSVTNNTTPARKIVNNFKENKIAKVISENNVTKNTHHESKTFELSKLVENNTFNVAEYIPTVSKKYIKAGIFNDISKIVKSKRFFPIMISGPKGCGKTELISQVAATIKRPLIRINITSETDESKLIGHMNLIDGNTVWTDGLIIKAMKMGAICVLDEVDLGSEKLMCLQSILEGSNYINKKTSEIVEPAEGFTIVMTSNTIGNGNTSGKYAGTRVMNSAFIDRLKMTFIFERANKATEIKILNSFISSFTGEESTSEQSKIISALVDWSSTIVDAVSKNIIEETISTRKLTYILESYLIFNNIEKCVKGSLNNYEDDDKSTMLTLWRTTYGIHFDETFVQTTTTTSVAPITQNT